jgi:hypothetical protein
LLEQNDLDDALWRKRRKLSADCSIYQAACAICAIYRSLSFDEIETAVKKLAEGEAIAFGKCPNVSGRRRQPSIFGRSFASLGDHLYQ